MIEVWKDIENLKDKYQISNFGRIKRLKHCVSNPGNPTGKIILCESVVTPKKPKIKIGNEYYYISHLVAEAFIRSMSEHDIIKHLDGNSLNNRLDNLEIYNTDDFGIDFTDIPNFPRYQVSRNGVIRRLQSTLPHAVNGTQTVGEMIIKPVEDKYGYLYVSITNFNTGKCCRVAVHRIVAQTFIPNPEDKPTVNHINGNKKDNSVGNLEWATVLEQNHHAIRTGLRDGNMNSARTASIKSISKPVLCVETGEIFSSCSEAERKLNLGSSMVHYSIRRGVKAHGYTFEYVDKQKGGVNSP